MAKPDEWYVNCHYCNARSTVSLGMSKLSVARDALSILISCDSCGSTDLYEPCMIRKPRRVMHPMMDPAVQTAGQPAH